MAFAYSHCSDGSTGSAQTDSIALATLLEVGFDGALIVFVATRNGTGVDRVLYSASGFDADLARLDVAHNAGGPRLEAWGHFGSFGSTAVDVVTATLAGNDRAVAIALAFDDAGADNVTTAAQTGEDLDGGDVTTTLQLSAVADHILVNCLAGTRASSGNVPVEPTDTDRTERCAVGTTNGTAGKNVFLSTTTKVVNIDPEIGSWDCLSGSNHDWAEIALSFGAKRPPRVWTQIVDGYA